MSPVVLTVSVSDPYGRVGIEADLRVINAHGCHTTTCITAMLKPSSLNQQITDIRPLSDIQSTLKALLLGVNINVVKTGFLTVDDVHELNAAIESTNYQGKIVVEPILKTPSGSCIESLAVLETILLKLKNKVTVLSLTGCEAKRVLKYYNVDYEVSSIDQMEDAAIEIANYFGCSAVLIREAVADETFAHVLYDAITDKVSVIKNKDVDKGVFVKTGSTLASSISSNIALGMPVHIAVDASVLYVQNILNGRKDNTGTNAML